MLLSNRRIALIYLCLAGIEAAWLLPLWLLAYRAAPGIWISYAILLASLLIWMLVLELLSRAGVKSPLYDLAALAMMALTSLLVVRVVLYPSWPGLGLGWLAGAVADVANYRAGFAPAPILIGFNLLIWQRATAATSRDLSFFSVGVAFRLRLLLLIAGGAFCTALREVNLLPLLWVYFAFGLTAVALARISEKASEAQSAGSPVPQHRLGQVLLAIGLTIGAISLLSMAYTPTGVRGFLRLFDPLWQLIRPMLLGLLLLLARLLNPVLLWFEQAIIRFLNAQGGAPEITAPPPITGEQVTALEQIPSWISALLTDAALVVGIVLAVLAVIIFLLLYLERVGRSGQRDETEEEGAEVVTLGGGILRRGIDALRNASRLIGRFGMGRQLLAAISVQNIYANLCRLAGRQGHPRPPAQPPDDYLTTLVRVFPGHDDALARITAAYMRVHYGDHPVTIAELAQLRDDYRAVREAASEREDTAGLHRKPVLRYTAKR